MSTKLYNGYKLNNMNMTEINEFILFLKKEISNMLEKKYLKFMANEFYTLLDNLSYSKHINDYEKLNSVIMHYYEGSRPLFNKKSNGKTIEEIKEDIFSIMFVDYHNNNILKTDVSMMRDPDLEYRDEVCLIPVDDIILLLAYGDELEELLTNIIRSEGGEYFDIKNKYNLCYFGYWNNTDKPSEVPDIEWRYRETMWNKAFKNGSIPANNGMNIDLYSYKYNLDIFKIKDKFDEFLSYIPSKEERAKNKILDVMKNEFLIKKYAEIGLDFKNLSLEDFRYSQFERFCKEFDDKINNDKDLILEFNNQYEKFIDCIIEINKKIFWQKTGELFNF